MTLRESWLVLQLEHAHRLEHRSGGSAGGGWPASEPCGAGLDSTSASQSSWSSVTSPWW